MLVNGQYPGRKGLSHHQRAAHCHVTINLRPV